MNAAEHANGDAADWNAFIVSREGWSRVADRYEMQWRMVWKDVTIGFTVAGIIAAYVPRSFFQSLFIGSGTPDLGFGDILVHTVVGPIAAFVTFIGSMGNIPLAAVLFGNGVSFAGVMALIFSDLVVLPVLRIEARYYGWKMALYIAAVFFIVLVATAALAASLVCRFRAAAGSGYCASHRGSRLFQFRPHLHGLINHASPEGRFRRVEHQRVTDAPHPAVPGRREGPVGIYRY